jgi:hypothetical protein
MIFMIWFPLFGIRKRKDALPWKNGRTKYGLYANTSEGRQKNSAGTMKKEKKLNLLI